MWGRGAGGVIGLAVVLAAGCGSNGGSDAETEDDDGGDAESTDGGAEEGTEDGPGGETGDPPPLGVIELDPPSQTFSVDFELSMSVLPDSADIHYTVDGTVPTEQSEVYVAPIPVDQNMRVRAVALDGGAQLGAEATATYLKIEPDNQGFSSNLPLVVWNTFELPEPDEDSNEFVPATMTVLTPNGGRTILGDRLATHDGRIGIHVRGSSTRRFAKKSYAVETWDHADEDRDVPLLGLPSESDWVFYGPANFDRAFVRNALIYELSNRLGRWAGRTRFVEVFFVTDQSPTVAASHYHGIYVLIEKIKRGRDRVDIAALPDGAANEPSVSGGYILKIDRRGPGDMGFHAGGSEAFADDGIQYVYPEELLITPEQASWIAGYIDEFAEALNAPNYVNPITGLELFDYVDADAWIDHHILNVLAKNPDAFRLSAYLYKDQSGPLEAGPAWDFDRTMQSVDPRDDDPTGWDASGDGTDLFGYGWWNRLFENPEFSRRYEQRWIELLDGGALDIDEIDVIIDAMATQLDEAAVRQYARWPEFAARGGSFESEVDLLKTWLDQRTTWIRSQYP